MDRKDLINGLSLLSDREMEVLYYWVKGNNRVQVGEWLTISRKTVGSHLTKISAKFGYGGDAGGLRDEIAEDFLKLFPNFSDLENANEILDEDEITQHLPPTQSEPPPNEPIEYEPPTEPGEPVNPPEEVVIIPPPPSGGQPPEESPPPIELPERTNRFSWRTFLVLAVIAGIAYLVFNWFDSRPPPPMDTEDTLATLNARATRIAGTLTPLPTNTLQSVLFFDNFEEELNPDWTIISGEPLIKRNDFGDRALAAESMNTWLAIGDDSWKNYKITLDMKGWGEGFERAFKIGTRATSISDMVVLSIWYEDVVWSEWHTIENGAAYPVPDTSRGLDIIDPEGAIHFYSNRIEITVVDNQYTLIGIGLEGDKELISSFFNSDYSQGKIIIGLSTISIIDNFRVIELP